MNFLKSLTLLMYEYFLCLFYRYANMSNIFIAAEERNFHDVKRLIESGTDFNAKNVYEGQLCITLLNLVRWKLLNI